MLSEVNTQVTAGVVTCGASRSAREAHVCSDAPPRLSFAADVSLEFGRAALAVPDTPARCHSRAAIRSRLATIQTELGRDASECVSTFYLWETVALLQASCETLVAFAEAETLAAIRVVLEVFDLRKRLVALAAILTVLRATVAATPRPPAPTPPAAPPEPVLLLRSLTVAPLAP